MAYTLVQTADGGISVTVCQDKAGTDESLQRAREWIQANASGTGVGAPSVSEGSVILQLKLDPQRPTRFGRWASRSPAALDGPGLPRRITVGDVRRASAFDLSGARATFWSA